MEEKIINRIFTYWDSEKEMPDYIKMCIESWHKYLKNHEIVILTPSNLTNWLDKNYYDKTLFNKFTIAQQTQAIRAAILEKHGGIWFDSDIIVTSSNIEIFFNKDSELNIFGDKIACLKAKKHSRILKKWIKGIKWNIFKYKYTFNFLFRYFPFKATDMMRWDYLSNRILRRLLKTQNRDFLNKINIKESRIYLEDLWDKENGRKFKDTPSDRYNYFYINNDFSDYAFSKINGLIILHNSWMPREYKTMSREQILNRNNTLAKIFKKILN